MNIDKKKKIQTCDANRAVITSVIAAIYASKKKRSLLIHTTLNILSVMAHVPAAV